MDQRVMTWAIPNYFIQNYLKSSFHDNCQVPACPSKGIQLIFLPHLISYFCQHIQIRGKWMEIFLLWQQNSEDVKAGDESKGEFFKLLQELEIKEVNVYLWQIQRQFIQFLVLFFRYICREDYSTNLQQEEFDSISKSYFKYRLLLSVYSSQGNNGSPPLVLYMLQQIFAALNRNSDVKQREQGENIIVPRLKQISSFCQLDHLYGQVFGNPTSITSPQFQKDSKDTEGGQNNEQKAQKNIFNTLQRMESKQFNQELFEVRKSSKSCQSLTKEEIVLKKSVSEAISKKKSNRNEKLRNIVKTTRESNFKGIFQKKQSKVSFCSFFRQAEIQVEAPDLKHKRILKENIKKRKVQNIEMCPDFLCDQSR